MFQIEIFEYTPRITDLYCHFFNVLENKSNNIQDNHYMEQVIENKFLKIKNIKNTLISQYMDYAKDDSKFFWYLLLR
jgi:hypothetical protein